MEGPRKGVVGVRERSTQASLRGKPAEGKEGSSRPSEVQGFGRSPSTREGKTPQCAVWDSVTPRRSKQEAPVGCRQGRGLTHSTVGTPLDTASTSGRRVSAASERSAASENWDGPGRLPSSSHAIVVLFRK